MAGPRSVPRFYAGQLMATVMFPKEAALSEESVTYAAGLKF